MTQTLINNVAPLANVARLTQLIDRCQNRAHGLPGMGCFFGRAGLGKTTAAIYSTNRFQACHVQALPIGGVKSLMNMIVVNLGLQPARTTEALFGQAVKELGSTQCPLIIDEADNILTDRAIEMVRVLYDMTGAPVILLGEELLPQKLQKWERVHSRILSWVGAEAATLADVDHLAKIYAHHVTLSADMKEAVLVASRGSIRNVATNLAHVREHAVLQGWQTISLDQWGQRPMHTGEAPAPRHAGAPRTLRAAIGGRR